MTTSTMSPTRNTTATECTIGSQIAFNCISSPGCYVSNATGHLVRMNEGWNANTMNSWCDWHGDAPMWFTCVSTDPNCCINECRTNACNAGIDCCF